MQTANKIIVTLTGRAGSGKDTAADYLVQHFGFIKLSWAGPLKAAMAAMGFPEPANRDDKEKLIPGFDFTWRRAAQTLGTEWGRALDKDIWVKIRTAQIAAAPAGSRFVIADTRFENEAAAVRDIGGQVLHVQGRAADLGAAAAHVSEEPVAILDDDWMLLNDEGIEYLHAQLEAMMGALGVEAPPPIFNSSGQRVLEKGCLHKWQAHHLGLIGHLGHFDRCSRCGCARQAVA